MISSNVTNRLVSRLFRKIGGVVWDLTTGNMGLKTDDGIASLQPVRDDAGAVIDFQVVANPFDGLSFKLPAFALNTPLSAVEPGDLIVGADRILGWAIKTNERSIDIKKLDGTVSKGYAPPKLAVFGGATDGILVVKNLLNLTGGSAGLSGLQNNPALLLLLNKNDEAGLDDLLPTLLLTQAMSAGTPQQANAGAAQANPMGNMMNMLLMSKMLKGGKGGGLGGLGTMMLLGGMGGAGGFGDLQSNPLLMMSLLGDGELGDLFGDSDPVALPAVTSNATRLPTPVRVGGAPTLRREW